MNIQNPIQLKEKIISIIASRGPILPSAIAKETGLSILFASAFLSELVGEKRLKMSEMKIGSSPLYYVPGQEEMLENFFEELKGRDKEAFILLKEKKFLKDSEQSPVTRVALRTIRDFAVPLRKNEEIYWRYFKTQVSELIDEESDKKKRIKLVIKKDETKEESQEDKGKKTVEKKIKKKKKRAKGKSSRKKDEKFFNKIKDFLSSREIEILSIESFSKNDVVLKIREKGDEKILVAYNKKRVGERDLISANKKASSMKMPYIVLSLGEIPKKVNELIESVKNLSDIRVME